MAQPTPDLESFRGDYDQLASTMRESWQLNPGQSFDYDASFLRSAFAYPSTSADGAPALYDDAGICGFVGGFPRTAKIASRTLNLNCLTFFTTRPDLHGKGLGSRIWGEGLLRAKQQGMDGCIHFCTDVSPTNRIAVAAATRLNFACGQLQSVKYLARLLPVAGAEAHESSGRGAADALARLSATLPEDTTLRRVWTDAEAHWQCVERTGAVTSYRKIGAREAVLTGYVMTLMGQTPTRILLIDDVLWHDFELEERIELLRSLLANAAPQNPTMAILPLLGYFDDEAFRRSGFRLTRRTMNAYLTLWEQPLPELPARSIYMDVF